MIDAITTEHAPANGAFDRLRGELHRAAGADGVAARRTLDTLAELRERADFFRETMQAFACQPLGNWYATLAVHHDALADEIAAAAEAHGIIGGET